MAAHILAVRTRRGGIKLEDVTGVALPRLQAIVDVDIAALAGWAAIDLARAILDGGARFLQLRAKQRPSGPFLELCDAVVALGASYQATVIVNDRVDLAKLSGAGGVHVGQEDLAPSAARELLGPGAIVGFSTHSIEQVEAALREPVSYVAVGPVFGTATKDTGYAAVGLELVAAAVRMAGEKPIVAIGGVTLDNAWAVIDAGASSVAVISDLLTDGDPAGRVAAFLRALQNQTF
jgi:thiamine-phosphate pyrophosphorylase